MKKATATRTRPQQRQQGTHSASNHFHPLSSRNGFKGFKEKTSTILFLLAS